MGIKRVAVLESNGETAQEIAECLKREGFEVCGVTDDGEKDCASSLRNRRTLPSWVWF